MLSSPGDVESVEDKAVLNSFKVKCALYDSWLF